MKKLILAAFLMAMFAVSSFAEVTSVSVSAETFPEYGQVFIYVAALDGETPVQELMTLTVTHRRKLNLMTYFYTNPFLPDAYIVFYGHSGFIYTATATAENGVSGSDMFVVE